MRRGGHLGVGVLARVICLDDWSDHPVCDLAGEATACTEVTSPLSEVQINCEQLNRGPGAQWPDASLDT